VQEKKIKHGSAAELSETDLAKIYGGNARQLLHIDPL
jgi:bacteriocin-like protein